MKKLLFLALFILAIGAEGRIFAQKLEDNCGVTAMVTDRDPQGLNVRDKPNAGGKVITRLKNGTGDDQISVYVVGYSNGWVKIGNAAKAGGGQIFSDPGWVSAKMVVFTVKSEGDQGAPLYEKANASSRKIGLVPAGATLQITGYDCFGIKVVYKGKSGWISGVNL